MNSLTPLVPLNGFRQAKCARKPVWTSDTLNRAAKH